MDARKLDRTVVLERRSKVVDRHGRELETWAPVATLAAQRLEAGSRELLRAYGQVAEGEAVFRTRYVAGITTADRLVVDGQPLEIVGVLELGRRTGIDIRTSSISVLP